MGNFDLRQAPLSGARRKQTGASRRAKLQTPLRWILSELGLRELSHELLAAIAAHLPQLTSLDLGYNRIGAEGAKAIAAHLPQLTSLDLGDNGIGDEGAKAIAAHLPQLTSLDLGYNGIGAEGAKAIAAHLPQLTSLNLWDNGIGDEGAKAIAAHLPQLTSLDLGYNSIGDEGAKAIAASSAPADLARPWEQRHRGRGREGHRRRHLPQLTSLNLGSNGIGDEGAKAIAAHLPQLTSLEPSGQRHRGRGREGSPRCVPGSGLEPPIATSGPPGER